MIIAQHEGGYRFITQPAHGRLAGQFAEHWGSNGFDAPEPRPAVVAATHLHDDGWWSYDRRPHLDDDGRLVGFTDVPAETWIAIYDEGIRAAFELDRYAGLLVSMHGTGLRRRRYGLSPTWPDTPPPFARFVDRHETQQRSALEELLASGDDRVTPTDEAVLSSLHAGASGPDDPGSRLWANYQLLQAWDTLSLTFCTTVSPPADREVGPVPRGGGAADTSIVISALGNGGFEIDPYPFDTDPIDVTVTARTVQGASFDTESTLFESYYRAQREYETFTLRSPA